MILTDTGPLVALIDGGEPDLMHAWRVCPI
jgi:hypothetical protein